MAEAATKLPIKTDTTPANTLYRLIFLHRHFAFDVDLFPFEQAGGFVRLV